MYLNRVLLLLLRRPLSLVALGVPFFLMSGLVLPVLVLGVVGFLLWLPIHSLVFGKDQGIACLWRQTRGRSKPGYRSHLGSAAAQLAHGWQQLRTWANRVGVFLVETASGAAIGGVLLLLSSSAAAAQIVLGALAGAGVGALVAVHRLQAVCSRKPVHEPLANEG